MFQSNWLLRQLPFLGRVDRWLGRFLTPVGKAVVVATFCFLLGASHLDTPVYQLFGASVSLLLVAWVGVLTYRPRLTYQTRTPSLVWCGQPFPLKLMAHNEGKRVACDLTFVPLRSNLAKSHLECDVRAESFRSIAVGNQVSVNWTMTARRRGVFPIPAIQMRSSFPFNLIFVSNTISPSGEIVVAPEFHPLRGLDLVRGAAGQMIGDRKKNSHPGDRPVHRVARVFAWPAGATVGLSRVGSDWEPPCSSIRNGNRGPGFTCSRFVAVLSS